LVTTPNEIHETDHDPLGAELDETLRRQPFTPSGLYRIGEKRRDLVKERAAQRRREGWKKRGKKGEPPVDSTEGSQGDVRDAIAEAVGLGWQTYERIGCVVKAAEQDDKWEPLVQEMVKAIKAEQDENTERKNWTPTEPLAIAQRLEPDEKKEAEQRLQEGQKQAGLTPGRGRKKDEADSSGKTLPTAKRNEQLRTKARTAKAAGISRPTLEKVKVVVEAAKQDPVRFAPVVKKMVVEATQPVFLPNKARLLRRICHPPGPSTCWRPSSHRARGVASALAKK